MELGGSGCRSGSSSSVGFEILRRPGLSVQVQSGGADPRDAEEAAAAQTGTRRVESSRVRFGIDKSSRFQCWFAELRVFL